jgi:hypothetical protein
MIRYYRGPKFGYLQIQGPDFCDDQHILLWWEALTGEMATLDYQRCSWLRYQVTRLLSWIREKVTGKGLEPINFEGFIK